MILLLGWMTKIFILLVVIITVCVGVGLVMIGCAVLVGRFLSRLLTQVIA